MNESQTAADSGQLSRFNAGSTVRAVGVRLHAGALLGTRMQREATETALICQMSAMRLSVALCLLSGLAVARLCAAAAGSNYAFSTGERLKFVGDSASLRYYPAAASAADCPDCALSFKLGALSELDAYGQVIQTHMLPDLSQMQPALASGECTRASAACGSSSASAASRAAGAGEV